jgi:integrase
MAIKRYKTEYPGVRYKEHPTRKHGIRADRYFSVVYRLGSKVIEEGLGWGSEGMTAAKASLELGKLKEAKRLGVGPQTLHEKRAINQQKREQKQREQEQEQKDALTFDQLFSKAYIEDADRTKNVISVRRERELYRLHIKDVLGAVPLKDISVKHIETVRDRMIDSGKAPATIRYALAVPRQVINYAKDHEMFSGDNPVSKVKKPKGDNKRVRFLSHEEASMLLDAIRDRSIECYNISLLSLHTGMRLGEITSLAWADVDFRKRLLTLRNTKNGLTRHARMTKAVFEMLFSLKKGKPNELVFPPRTGAKAAKVMKISRTFERCVDALMLNEGIMDPRQQVVFHSLRHTFASWMIEGGASLFTVSKLLGHNTIAMTERYSHVAEKTLQQAVQSFENSIDSAAVKTPKTDNQGA